MLAAPGARKLSEGAFAQEPAQSCYSFRLRRTTLATPVTGCEVLIANRDSSLAQNGRDARGQNGTLCVVYVNDLSGCVILSTPSSQFAVLTGYVILTERNGRRRPFVTEGSRRTEWTTDQPVAPIQRRAKKRHSVRRVIGLTLLYDR